MTLPLFPGRVNWSSSLKVTREYRTTVQISRSGKEQRRGLRLRPRKTLEFDFLTMPAYTRQMMGWLKANIGQDILVADESRRAVVTTG